MFCYRGIICYKDSNISNISFNNKIKIIKNDKIYKILLLIHFSYLLIINVCYNKNINIKSWQFYPFYIFIIIFVLIFHPIIIYLLNKINSDLKYDFVYSFIIIFSCFTIFVISYFNVNNRILNYISSYWSIISSVFIHFSSTFLHILHIKQQKNYEQDEPTIERIYREIHINNFEYDSILNIINQYDSIKKNMENDGAKKFLNLFNCICNDNKIVEIIKNDISDEILKIENMNIYIKKLKKYILKSIYERIE